MVMEGWLFRDTCERLDAGEYNNDDGGVNDGYNDEGDDSGDEDLSLWQWWWSNQGWYHYG